MSEGFPCFSLSDWFSGMLSEFIFADLVDLVLVQPVFIGKDGIANANAN